MNKICVLDEQNLCNECGSCSRCGLDPKKICDNCMKCVQESDAEYYEILIDDISKPDPEMEKMLRELLKGKESENKNTKKDKN